MKIYIVAAGYDYEGYDNLYATNSRYLAERWMDSAKKEYSYDNWRIQEMNVDIDSDEDDCYD